MESMRYAICCGQPIDKPLNHGIIIMRIEFFSRRQYVRPIDGETPGARLGPTALLRRGMRGGYSGITYIPINFIWGFDTKYYIVGTIQDKDIEDVYLGDLRAHYRRIQRGGDKFKPLGYGETFWKNAGIYHPEQVFGRKDW